MKIHSKKRNRLAQKRLNDLVYVKYNRALKRRYEARDRIDPITLKDIDDSNEWLTGVVDGENQEDENDFVFDDDSLTWGAVARASGAGEEAYNTRSVEGKGKNVVGSTSFAKSRTKQVEKGNTSHKRVPRGLRDEEEETFFRKEKVKKRKRNLLKKTMWKKKKMMKKEAIWSLVMIDGLVI
ncbi:hypothetical protein OROHE_010887 [Orobanche hederae]